MKNIVKIAAMGIGIALTVFTIIGVISDIANGGTYTMANWTYTKGAVGCIIVGIAWSVPSLIYKNERLPLGMQMLFHMGIGCTVYLITAFIVGWIPISMGFGTCALVIVGELLIAFLIWIGFSIHYRNLAKKMNEKLSQK